MRNLLETQWNCSEIGLIKTESDYKIENYDVRKLRTFANGRYTGVNVLIRDMISMI